MLHRSLSSQRRRRASRSAASSPNRLGAPGASSASRSPRGSISAASGISALGTSTSSGAVSPGSKTGRRASISAGEGLSRLGEDDLGRHDRLAVNKTSPRGTPNSYGGDSVSPRNSRLSLAPDLDVVEFDRGHRRSIAPELLSGEMTRSSRNTLAPEKSRSPRNSLTPDAAGDYTRRSSLAPDFSRSPRGSLVPEFNRSPRNSLVPDNSGYNRSPRNSLCPDATTPNRSPRHSLVPDGDGYNRSPRPSIAVDRDVEYSGRSPRPSLVPDMDGYNRSPRSSIAPDVVETSRSPRPSLIPSDGEFNRGPRPSMIPADVEFNRSPRSSLVPDNGEYNRSPRPSLIPADVEFNRSPRSSLVPDERSERGQDLNRSPRGSIGGDQASRSPRGSYVQEMGTVSRSPRGSIGAEAGKGGSASPYNRSPRGSLIAEMNRSPRNSLSPRGSLTGRDSVDLTMSGAAPKLTPDGLKHSSSQRSRLGRAQEKPPEVSSRPPVTFVSGPSRTGSLRRGPANTGPGSGAPGRPVGYGPSWVEAGTGGSRRASSNPSQVSGDDRRQLCAEHTKLAGESATGLTSYGSVMYQLKDANIEASGTCDFVLRALRIVYQTVVVTVLLVCLTFMPVIMLFMGVKFLRDCPREPHLPVYMLVGGILGSVRMVWLVWRQWVSRRYAQLGAGLGTAAMDSDVAASLGVRIACGCLSFFLMVWFCLGNYWTLGIMWPSFAPELYKPNEWCDKTLYVFALVHLGVCYVAIATCLLAAISLSCYQVLVCPLVMRYK